MGENYHLSWVRVCSIPNTWLHKVEGSMRSRESAKVLLLYNKLLGCTGYLIQTQYRKSSLQPNTFRAPSKHAEEATVYPERASLVDLEPRIQTLSLKPETPNPTS